MTSELRKEHDKTYCLHSKTSLVGSRAFISIDRSRQQRNDNYAPWRSTRVGTYPSMVFMISIPPSDADNDVMTLHVQRDHSAGETTRSGLYPKWRSFNWNMTPTLTLYLIRHLINSYPSSSNVRYSDIETWLSIRD
jgi:hypothetical protein